jgi:hypothetical protein
VPELLAASEAVLLTSIQEGFGLPYVEAAAAGRPLIARHLPNIAPDLHKFGFRLPQAYDEILVARTCSIGTPNAPGSKNCSRAGAASAPALRKLVGHAQAPRALHPTGSSAVQPPYPYGATGSAGATLPGTRGNYARH